MYLDDKNIEREVPLEEIAEASEDSRRSWSQECLSGMMQEGLATLSASNSDDTDSTQLGTSDTNMRWEQGRYVADDGSLILCTNAGLLGMEVLKNDLAEPGNPACGMGLRGIRSLRKKNRPQAPPVARH